jgi:uncharacterized membrane protein
MLHRVRVPKTRKQQVRWRNMLALAAGGVTLGVVAASGKSWPVVVTSGWVAAAVVILLSVGLKIWWKTPAQTKANAHDEDFSRWSADFVVLGAAAASLVAIFYLVHEAASHHGFDEVALIALAVGSVVLSWLVVQTVYTVRYGDLYYRGDEGGIDFNTTDPPDYHDFLYLAFTMGMTFQVSDTDLQTNHLRRTAIRHALLSFVFVAVLLAVTINVVASLLK